MTANNYNHVPEELKARSQWVNWRFETDATGRQTKRPLNPANGYAASVIDTSHWGTFEIAVANTDKCDGIGYVLTQDDPFTCIDLDDPFKGLEQGTKAWAEAQKQRDNQQALMYRADSYAEISPSGNGAHIWVKGIVPTGVRSGKTEIYSAGRFITVTGNPISPIGYRIVDAQPLLNELYQAIRPSERSDDAGCDEPQKLSDQQVIDRVQQDAVCAAIAAGDRTLWESNKRSQYPDADVSPSQSDLALMNRIAAISRNREQTERLFRSSNAFRSEKKGDYVRRTVSRAFDNIGPLANINSDAIRQSANAATAGEQGAQAANTPYVDDALDLDRIMDVARTHPGIQWATESMMPVGNVSILNSDGGVGKTQLTLQWAMAGATGRPFLGQLTQQGPALFVSAEDGIADLAHRIAAIRSSVTSNGFFEMTDDMCRNFRFWEPEAPELWVNDRDNVAGKPGPMWDQLERRIVQYGAKHLFLDNVSIMFQGNPNDSTQVYAFVRRLRAMAERHGCSILMLAHVSANSAVGTSTKNYFGSTAWNNAVRSRFFMKKVPAQGSNPEHILLVHEKTNHGPELKPIKLKRDSNGVLHAMDEAQIDRIANVRDGEVMERLIAVIDAEVSKGRPITSAKTGSTNFYKVLTTLDKKAFPQAKPAKEHVETLIDKLVHEGRIIETTYSDSNSKRERRVFVPTGWVYGMLGWMRTPQPLTG